MEFTEDMLRMIADNLTDLRARVSILQQVTIREDNAAAYNEMLNKFLESPKFQEECEKSYQILKGNG